MLLTHRQVAFRVAGFTTLVMVSASCVFLSIFHLGTLGAVNHESFVAKRFFPNPLAFITATQPVTAPPPPPPMTISTPQYEPPHDATEISPPAKLMPRTTTAPRASPTQIPKKLWYKVGPQGMSVEMRKWTDTCIDNNPGYRVEFLTDRSGDDYVKQTFASRPDVVRTYLALNIPIIKADLLRYLLLFAEGGIWSDLDVSCNYVPIDEWVPARYAGKADLVVGWEFDMGWGYDFRRQFATWTIMARPGLSHMWMVIEDIIEGLYSTASRHNVTLQYLSLDMVGDIVDVSGPARFTESVLRSLEGTFGSPVDLGSISEILEPKLIEDVLIMPAYAFAASANNYGQRKGLGPALVTHHYAGTWKNKYGGELAK